MTVLFGENDIKSVEDLAGLIPDDLRGYVEIKNGEKVREPGILESFAMSEPDANMLIMQARVKAGWIDASALNPEPEVELDEQGNPIVAAEEAVQEVVAG